MAQIISVDFTQKKDTIDVTALKKNNRRLEVGLISPATEDVEFELVTEHSSEPIKDMDDIIRISDYLIAKKRYRDNMLFIVGINFGLRVSDLITLRFTQLINDEFVFRDRFPVLEKKTKNTRKHKRNRYVTINTAVIEAVTLYLEHSPGVTLSDYLFQNESSHKGKEDHIDRTTVHRILKGIASDLGLGGRVATHTLRKTFCYHQMLMSGNDPRKLLLLQKMLGHSSAAQTLDYIGITEEEIDEAYQKLNLGSRTSNYLIDSAIGEEAVETIG